jgi:hypothetical protein
VIVIEDLPVRNMVRNRRLARAISDCGWGEFRRQLEYKCQRYGREMVVLDRWYPSSKTCSACGHLLAELSLSTRHWTCPPCGTRHDRDINAAKNILAAGQAVTACGAGIRHAGTSRVRSAVNQEARPVTAGIPEIQLQVGSSQKAEKLQVAQHVGKCRFRTTTGNQGRLTRTDAVTAHGGNARATCCLPTQAISDGRNYHEA